MFLVFSSLSLSSAFAFCQKIKTEQQETATGSENINTLHSSHFCCIGINPSTSTAPLTFQQTETHEAQPWPVCYSVTIK